jgi:hypothetical protein
MLASILFAFASQSPGAPAVDPTITVAGRRIVAEHDACAKGGCPPVRDANATLAYAQQRLLAGDYKGSRRALQAALRRQAGAAKTHPLAVSALYDADSTLALHTGNHIDARRSGLKSVALLRGVYAPGDPRLIAARVRAGDLEAKVGGFDALANADLAYDAAAREARRAGHATLADAIELRRAWLLTQQGQAAAAQNRLVRYADDPSSQPKLRLLAAVLAARVARDRGDAGTSDRMLALVGQQPAGAKPLLLSGPDMNVMSLAGVLAERRKFNDDVSQFEPTSTTVVPLRWVDVGFWIRPNGRVEEAEILRGSPSRDWARPVLAAIEGRRYAATDAAPGDPGSYRLERYTHTAEAVVPKGSLIKRRAGAVLVRRLDITDDPDRKTEGQLPAS